MYSEINPYIEKLAELSDNSNSISPDMYKEHNVFMDFVTLTETE